jgi:polar amino acid transport system permease protein
MGPKPVRWLVDAYVEVIRNTPFLVQIFLIFFGLPRAGIMLSSNQAALLAMVVNVGAYATEIVRAGIEHIGRGQIEAGLALGLRPLQVFRYVMLFPALSTVYPALSSQFILLMLNSSVVSTISAQELTATANDLQSRTFRSFEIYIVVTGIYLALSMLFSGAFGGIYRTVFARPGQR